MGFINCRIDRTCLQDCLQLFFSSFGLQDWLCQGIYGIQFTFEIMMMYVPQILFIYFKLFNYHKQIQDMWSCGKSYSVNCLFEELFFQPRYVIEKDDAIIWDPKDTAPIPS